MEKNSTETPNQYTFLTNKPLGEDLFKNKSQNKIACVISSKIINKPDFKIIGIDGEWGSGKSNLVKLIENELTNSHEFFIYDVWGHQEDEQRKSILVELTEFIKNKPGLLKKNRNNWDIKLKELLANSKETMTINQPYLSAGFIFSLLSIVYIPSVNVFKDSIKNFLEINSWFWKLVLVTFPIFIVFGIYLYNFLKNWYQKNGFWKSFKMSAEETFQVYTNKQKEETKIETISENQPSVRDFQNWMKEIDEDLNKKVVIVFDNFDRLPKKHILNIWSSIHIFFAEKGYENIKVIVPFDREHIQNAFKELNGNDRTFGDDYVNKTFDIVFRVTLPIMSDWKEFFENQWKKAFLDFDKNELNLVVQVYEFLNRRITPREIISFINEILTIKLLDINFKERYVAIFVLKKDVILKDPLNAITNLDYLMGLKSFYHNDPEFAKQLTAIIYHIEVEMALELIYTQKLRDSLNKNDVEQFNTICKSEFIDSIFNSAISELEVLENPIKTLSKLEPESNLSMLHISQAWDLFYYKTLIHKQKIENLEIEDWQLLLIQNHLDNQYLLDLLTGYLDVLDDTNSLEYANLIDEIVDNIGDDRVSNLMSTQEINPKSLIEIIESRGDDYRKYQLTSNEIAIDRHLSNIKIEEILKLKHTDVLTKDFDLTGYIELLKTNLNSFVDQNNIQTVNDIVIKLKETSKGNADLKDVLEESRIYTLYVNNSASLLPIVDDLLAMRIAKGASFHSSYISYFQALLTTDNKELATKLSFIILHYINYGSLLSLAKVFKDSVLYKQMVLSMFPNTELPKTANIVSLIGKYEEIKSALDIVDDKLLNELNRWPIDKTKLDIEKFSNTFLEDCFKYRDIAISESVLELFNEEFASLERESFKTVFGDGSDVHFQFFENLNSESLTQTSLDIFEEQLLIRLEQGNIDNRWWDILKIYELNNDSLSVVNSLKNVRDHFLRKNIELDIDTALNILPYFFKYNLLSPDSDVFRTIIKNNFMTDVSFIGLLLSHGDYIKSLYQDSNPSEKEGFRNIVNEKRETIEILERLAKHVGIRKAKDRIDD